MPKHAQVQVKADYWAIFDLPDDVEPGPEAVAEGAGQDRLVRQVLARLPYPAAVRSLLDDRESLTVYLRFPREATGTASGTPTSSSARSGRRGGASR